MYPHVVVKVIELASAHRFPDPPDPPNGGSDPRQAFFERISGNVTRSIGNAAFVQTANTSRGYCAAAVNVGELQRMIENGLRRTNMETVAARKDEVVAFIERLVTLWVQRLKEMNVEVRDNGIYVAIQTQDDLGYYRYTWDVFPGRRPDSGGIDPTSH